MKNNKLFLREYLEKILAVSKEGKALGIDTGVARDIFINAVRQGKVPEGEDKEVQNILTKLFSDADFSALKARYDAQTGPEREADLADFSEAVRARRTPR